MSTGFVQQQRAQGATTNTSSKGGAHGDPRRCNMSPVAQGTYVGQHLIPNTSLRILESGAGEDGPWKTDSDSYNAVFSKIRHIPEAPFTFAHHFLGVSPY